MVFHAMDCNVTLIPDMQVLDCSQRRLAITCHSKVPVPLLLLPSKCSTQTLAYQNIKGVRCERIKNTIFTDKFNLN